MAEQECFPCGEDYSLEDRIRQSFKCDGSGGTFIQGSKLNPSPPVGDGITFEGESEFLTFENELELITFEI